ncbi:MAG: hypothetical protein WA797_02310 [Acidimicrobiales bacterium]
MKAGSGDGAIDDLHARLVGLAEELGDLAFTRLREAAEAGETAGPELERRLTRARRAVEKAAHLLEDRGNGEWDGD